MLRASCFRYAAVLSTVLLMFVLGCGGGSTRPTTGETWRYVALGDSLAAGFSADIGYVQRYSDYTQSDNDVAVTRQNLGRPGWESEDLLNALRNDSGFRDAVSSADVVTWDIGGNDLLRAYRLFLGGACGGADNQACFRDAVANFRSNWDAIIREMKSLTSTERAILRTMDIYNPFVGEQHLSGTFEQTQPYLDQVNEHIRSSAEQNGIPFARVHQAFNGTSGTEDPVEKGLISADRFHASDAGHKVMADLLRELGYAPKRPAR